MLANSLLRRAEYLMRRFQYAKTKPLIGMDH